MPITSKILIPIIAVVAVAFIWLATAVLEARNTLDKGVKAKLAEVAKVTEEVNLYERGDDDARKAFKDFAEKEILPLASQEANRVYKDRLDTGVDAIPAFAVAMDSFVDPNVFAAFNDAVAKLNELQRTPVIEETEYARLQANYDAAERDLKQQFDNLDTAYALLLGQAGQTGGMPEFGRRKVDGVYRGLGIDALRNLLVHVGKSIQQQKIVYVTILSDIAKNSTQLQDKRDATRDQAAQIQKAATGAAKESEERQKDVDEANRDLAKEKLLLADWEKKRDAELADFATLTRQFEIAQNRSIELTQRIKQREVELDIERGIRHVILSENGNALTGTVQSVDPRSGTIRVNVGTRHSPKLRSGTHLHVYRMSPQAKYLGILVVAESDSDGSTGRMLPQYSQLPIKVGDSVTNELTSEALFGAKPR